MKTYKVGRVLIEEGLELVLWIIDIGHPLKKGIEGQTLHVGRHRKQWDGQMVDLSEELQGGCWREGEVAFRSSLRSVKILKAMV